LTLGHNHPSGDPEPSHEDRALTRRLVQAGGILGIAVLDHIIVGDGKHCSLQARGMDFSSDHA
jgi:DNA repair protein RadC